MLAMPSPTSTAQAAATILAQRRLHGQQGPCLPEPLRPQSLDEAMHIQLATMPLMSDTIAGWKCGTPGPDKLVVAPIYARTVHKANERPCAAWAHGGAVRVEPELAFVLGQDLPARVPASATST